MTDSWMWIEEGGAQHGPLNSNTLIRLIHLREQLHPKLPTMTVWQVGSTDWVPAIQTEPFRDHILALTSTWFYAYPSSANGTSQPKTLKDIAKLFDNGDLDGLTMLFPQSPHWSTPPTWTALSELPAVKKAISIYNNDDSGAPSNVDSAKFNSADMVYERDQQQSLPIDKDDDDDDSGGEVEHYVSDDGTRFVMEKGSWTEFNGTDEEWKVIERPIKEEENHKSHISKNKDDNKKDEENKDNENTKPKKRKKSKKSGWSDKAQTDHNWVYVEGIPSDATAEEISSHFAKCGVIAIDPRTLEPKIKIYRDKESGLNKGDASVCYANADSVPLALQVLDGGRLRTDTVISVKKAEFNLKGKTFDPTKRAKVSGAAKKVAKAAEAQSLTWDEGEERKGVGLKIVVLMGMFDPKDFEEDENFENELTSELGMELEEKVGEPEKMTLFSKNPLGVVIVKFKNTHAAAECIKLMHGRFFAGRRLSCMYWDGVTDYTVEVAEEVEEERIEQFGDWIEEQELPPELQLNVEE